MKLGRGWRRAFGLRPESNSIPDIAGELDFHVSERVRELVQQGLSEEAARAVVRQRFGDVDRIAQLCARIESEARAKRWRRNMLDDLRQDVWYALRLLWRNPGYTIIAAGTLALGIGANTAIFSVVNAVLLRELPYAEPERLAMVWLDNRVQGFPEDLTSYPSFVHLRDENQTLADIAAYRMGRAGLTGSGDPERITNVSVSSSFFDVLGVPALVGMTLSGNGDLPGGESVAVLSHGLWSHRFGADEAMIGRTISLDGITHTVVGVMPPSFDFPEATDVWTALTPNDQLRNSYGSLWLYTVARLGPGVTPVQAQADLDQIMSRVGQERMGADAGSYGAAVNLLHVQLVGDVRSALWILFGAVGMVLLIACANVANLSLARATSRAGEIVMRSALGAAGSRLIRQLLTESVVLATVGGVLGLTLAYAGVRLVTVLAPANLPRMDDVGVDGTVLAFTAVVTVIAGLIFGTAPALRVTGMDIQSHLKENATNQMGQGRRQYRKILVAGEVSVAVVLLIGAGLLVKSFARMHAVDLGFETDGLVSMRLTLPSARYPEADDVRRFHSGVVEQVSGIPGIMSVGMGTAIMIGDFPGSGTFSIEGRTFQPEEAVEVLIDSADPSLFRVLGVPLIRGRFLGESDGNAAAPVLVINQSMAEMFWPDQDPIGQRITFGNPGPDAMWFTIVGVVGDRRRAGFQASPRPATFYPYALRPTRTVDIIVKSERASSDIIPAIRRAVWGLDPGLPIDQLERVDVLYRDRAAGPRFNMVVLGLLAGIALAMSVAGVYGVTAHAVSQRSREMGLRMALGARGRDIVRLMMSNTMQTVSSGLIVGIVLALGLTRFLSGLVFNVSETDASTFVTVVGSLALAGLLAALVPARRAARLQAVQVLKGESKSA